MRARTDRFIGVFSAVGGAEVLEPIAGVGVVVGQGSIDWVAVATGQARAEHAERHGGAWLHHLGGTSWNCKSFPGRKTSVLQGLECSI